MEEKQSEKEPTKKVAEKKTIAPPWSGTLEEAGIPASAVAKARGCSFGFIYDGFEWVYDTERGIVACRYAAFPQGEK